MGEMCCHKDKGWKAVEIPVGGDETTIPVSGLYQVRVINQGEVSLKVGSAEITPGNCMAFGIDWLPCAENLNCEWSEESGLKRAIVTGVRIIPFCCEP
jgi:hypothetical protein